MLLFTSNLEDSHPSNGGKGDEYKIENNNDLIQNNGRKYGGRRCSGLLIKWNFLTFLLVLLSVISQVSSTSKHEIHKQMSVDELRKVFQVDSHDQVPDYDLVHVGYHPRRSPNDPNSKTKQVHKVHLKPFGKAMKLHLKPNHEFNNRIKTMKIFMASTDENGNPKYEEDNKDTHDIGQAYHDDRNMAAVMLTHTPDGRVQMDGTIGNEYIIKPYPSRISSPFYDGRDDDEMFLDEDEAFEMEKRRKEKKERIKAKRKNAHIVYRKRKTEESHSTDYAEFEPGVLEVSGKHDTLNITFDLTPSSSQTRSRRTKRQVPEQVWPEVLLVVDYDSYLLHGSNSRDVKRYFISFWNGVDLRYKLLSRPSIRVSLAGMIVAKDREATPYLERNRLRSPNADAVDAAGALTDMGKYLYREDRLPTYDLAVVITKLDMCRRRFEGGRCNRGTAGFAYVGGACVVNKRLEKVNSVAIIEDSGGFSGIIVAAHEVGHLLGCVHDGSPPPSYLGGPGATRCPWEDGFIMSDLRHTERGFRWSSCSVEQFKHFLYGETATCLYNYPHENQLLPRILPGTMLSLDEQCKRDRGTNACFKDARVCAQLFCFDSASGYCVSYRPAAEGSPCGDGQVCTNGKCAAEVENIIPDYTHVTQTISRPPISRSDNGPTRTASRRRSLDSRLRSRSGRIHSTQSLSPRRGGGRKRSGNGQSQGGHCLDMVEKMAGSLSCQQFLKKFGYRYCSHTYIKKNCCASHSEMCKQ